MFPSPFARLFGMVSAPFDNEQYRNQQRKAIQRRNSYQKVIICPSEPRRLIFAYCGAISALPEGALFGFSGAILERWRGDFIDYSGAKYVRSALKIALTWKSLFRVVENGKFLNRLLNGHFEKSAATGIFRV